MSDVPGPGELDRGPRWATAGVLGLAALLPLVELGRIALVEPPAGVVTAAVLVLAGLPLHLRHVAHALRGERAPHAGWSLAALAVLMGLGPILVTANWGLVLASLAVSVLLVVRPPWSPALFAAVLLGAWVEGANPLGALLDEEPSTGIALYVAGAVAFRSVCLFVIIRLVAQVGVLDRARATIARQAVEHQRAQTALHLTRSLTTDLERLGERAAQLPGGTCGATGEPGATVPEGPVEAGTVSDRVGELVRDARALLGEVRAIVGRTRGARAQRELADAGHLLRGGAVGARAGRDHRAGPMSAGPPVSGLVGSSGQSIVLLVLVRVVVVGMLSLLVAGVSWSSSLPSWVYALVAVVAAAELGVALRTTRGRASGTGARVLAGVAVVTAVAGMVLVPSPNQLALALEIATAAAVMTLRGRLPVLAVALSAAVVLFGGLQELDALDPTAALVVWYVPYLLALYAVVVGSLVASAHLVGAVRALEATRAVLAVQAVDEENRRFARDLHDTLVQSLSAVALTGDLVLRLLPRDTAAAARETEHLRALAARLADDVRRVGAAQREVTLAQESEAAAQLLHAAGVAADIHVGAIPPTPQTDALLGWAVREAATNVVRHSAATRCAISVVDDGRYLGLLVVNDGVRTRPQAAVRDGTGLAGLADRVRAVRGSVHAQAGGSGEFRLHVRVPRVPA